MYIALVLLTRLDIWIIEDLQAGVCLTYLGEITIG